MVTSTILFTPYYIITYASEEVLIFKVVSSLHWNVYPSTIKPNGILNNLNLPKTILKFVKYELASSSSLQ